MDFIDSRHDGSGFNGSAFRARTTKTITGGWSVGLTPDGQPDLEGVWDAASLTPLERPVELGNKEFYTLEEVVAYEKQRNHDLDRDRRDGSADADLGRAYNDGWFDRGSHLASNHRTSRLIDPPNGRFPAMTPASAKKYQEIHAWLGRFMSIRNADAPIISQRPNPAQQPGAT